MPKVPLDGVYDLHIHPAPDVQDRIGDDAEIAAECLEAGMAGIVLKSHVEQTCSRAHYARKIVPGIAVYGSICLNDTVGGLNCGAVETALKLGLKMVWMPTQSSVPDVTRKGTGRVVRVLDTQGRLLPEAITILELIAQHDIALSTGHLSAPELEQLIPAAVEAGCKKICLTHVNVLVDNWTLDKAREFVGMGAMAEFCAPTQWGQFFNQAQTKEWIEALGAEHCYLSSDGGGPRKASPPEAMRPFIYTLGALGISARDLQLMTRDNPQWLVEG